MIFDKAVNFPVYEALQSNIKKAVQFINETDLGSLPAGRHEIDGDNVFAMIQNYDTKESKDGEWEAHKKYLDIQYMISGTEKVGIASIDNMKVLKDYDEKDDYWLFIGEGDFITLDEGMFTIFFPQDVHMTSLQANHASQAIKKAVIKVQID